MIKQITIDENNVVQQCSIGGYIENGIDVEDIPNEVMANPSMYCYVGGIYTLNPNYYDEITDLDEYFNNCTTINLTYTITNNCYFIYNNQTVLAVHCEMDTPYSANTLQASAELHITALKEKIKENKIAQIKQWCEDTIIFGTDCDILNRGNLHYSLSKTKQEDIKILYQNIQAGATSVLWHDDSRVMHEVYSATQFINLFNQIYAYTISNKIYSDGLEQYCIDLANEDDYTTLTNIVWGTKLPTDIQSIVNQQIVLMLGLDSNE